MTTNDYECPGSADVPVGTRAGNAELPRAWQSPHPAIDSGRLQSIAASLCKVGGACSSPGAWAVKIQRQNDAKLSLCHNPFTGELEAPPTLWRRRHLATDWERGASAPRQSLRATTATLPRRKLQTIINQ
jgi:hypothetical protein